MGAALKVESTDRYFHTSIITTSSGPVNVCSISKSKAASNCKLNAPTGTPTLVPRIEQVLYVPEQIQISGAQKLRSSGDQNLLVQ